MGTEIWQALQGGGTLQQALDRVQAAYDVEADVLRADGLRFVNQMAAKGLVQAAR